MNPKLKFFLMAVVLLLGGYVLLKIRNTPVAVVATPAATPVKAPVVAQPRLPAVHW